MTLSEAEEILAAASGKTPGEQATTFVSRRQKRKRPRTPRRPPD